MSKKKMPVVKDGIKRMDLNEFVKQGFLQELNRRCLHPVGLALEVLRDPETGEIVSLGGIWDYRDEPEGLQFPPNLAMKEKAQQYDGLLKRNSRLREEKWGSPIQPIE